MFQQVLPVQLAGERGFARGFQVGGNLQFVIEFVFAKFAGSEVLLRLMYELVPGIRFRIPSRPDVDASLVLVVEVEVATQFRFQTAADLRQPGVQVRYGFREEVGAGASNGLFLLDRDRTLEVIGRSDRDARDGAAPLVGRPAYWGGPAEAGL